tara:strand:+ start:845 stop:1117 length:273 start_codon:yes stop_codon:yes gene_type:complete
MKRKTYYFRVNDKATATGSSSILKRIFFGLIGLASVILAFMFSIVLLAIISVVVVGLFIFFWWKTRNLRKNIREANQEGRVFDGESRRDN